MERLVLHFPECFSDFSDQSKVWIYPASRKLNIEEIAEIEQEIDLFCKQWTAHQQALRALGWIAYDRFLILTVDESSAGASGCSIDKSVAFLQNMGRRYNIDFFDRLTFYYTTDEGEIATIHHSLFSKAVDQGTFSPKTLFINTLASDKNQLLHWLLPFEDSWQYKMLRR